MKLIVGLGNPGKEYENTRHNIGFSFIDFYLDSTGTSGKWTNKFEGEYLEASINGEKVIFLKPQTYMNLSGNSVRKVMDYFNIDVSDILIIADDLDIKVGNFKLKSDGSCGGHNGLRNIEACIGTTEYKRLKIGISKNVETDTKDYVLGNFSKEERETLKEVFKNLVEVIDDYFKLPFGDLMSKHNRKNK